MSLYHNSPSNYYKNVNRTFNTSLRDDVVISNKKAFIKKKCKILDLNKWKVEKNKGNKQNNYIVISNTIQNWNFRSIYKTESTNIEQVNDVEHNLITRIVCILRKKCKYKKITITDILGITFLKKNLFNILEKYSVIRIILNICNDGEDYKNEMTIILNSETDTLNILYEHVITDKICFSEQSSIIPKYPLYNIELIFKNLITDDNIYENPTLCIVPYCDSDIYNTTNIILNDTINANTKNIKINLEVIGIKYPIVEIFFKTFNNTFKLITTGEINTKIPINLDSHEDIYRTCLLIRLKNFKVGDILRSTEIYY